MRIIITSRRFARGLGAGGRTARSRRGARGACIVRSLGGVGRLTIFLGSRIGKCNSARLSSALDCERRVETEAMNSRATCVR